MAKWSTGGERAQQWHGRKTNERMTIALLVLTDERAADAATAVSGAGAVVEGSDSGGGGGGGEMSATQQLSEASLSLSLSLSISRAWWSTS